MKALQVLPGWPARRWVAVALLLGPLTFLYSSVGGLGGWVWPVALVTAALAAVLLASYLPLPGAGLRPDTGCTPCAGVSGLAVLGSLMMRSLAPGDAGIAVVAVGMVAFGLGQRFAGAVSCPAPR